MKVSDYIVEFLLKKGITDVFGYPGGMVTQLMDSFSKYSNRISAHVTYHEQGAAFAACGYAQTSGKPGVAYATSGPGATNLITGICDAFFDSIPTIFITGQVNSNESKGAYGVRQRGFQETDIISMVRPVTKYAVYMEQPEDVPYELEKAYDIAMSGRRGPVLLDIPMNVFRAEIEAKWMETVPDISNNNSLYIRDAILEVLNKSKSPAVLIGAGIKSANMEERVRKALTKLGIPVISSMIAFDVMKDCSLYYGFIGAYGTRSANFIAAKSDLIISIGSRMDIRQVGVRRENFAPEAKIIRFDIDEGELEYSVHNDEIQVCASIEDVVYAIENINNQDYSEWISVCDEIKKVLADIDKNSISSLIETISKHIPDEAIITTDVGQNQVWVAQSFEVKSKQKVLFSGGHGAMGYSLPAAIGAYYGSGRKPVYCITGDGGLQMNIQELQFIAREQLPIKIIVLNNNALGMIRHFQEMYFKSNYFQTKPEGGYTSPDFAQIALAYGINGQQYDMEDVEKTRWNDGPELVEYIISENTYVTPKLEFGKPNQDQEPLIDRELYNKIMNMTVKEDK